MNEICHYQCILEASGYRIILKGRRFRTIGQVLFRDSDQSTPRDLPTLVLPRSDYAGCIDMLRNEKPVFFDLQEETHQLSLFTGDEPVGENE